MSNGMSVRAVSVAGKTSSTKFNVPETWEPIKLLGSGAYAAVAAFRLKDSEFAVKKVDGVFGHNILALRTLREVRVLAHFRHPNILGIRQLFVDGSDFKDAYLVLEIMDSDLHTLIHYGKKALTGDQVQYILYQIMRGLLCLRMAHVLHRDLKPGNILVKAGGEVKIADLGLARSIDAEEDENDQQVLTEYVVTRYYRAPEVVLTAMQYTYAVDIWSTGCIFGEMMIRHTMFQGKDSLDQIRQIVCFMGNPSADEMSWIAQDSAAWKFMEKCNQASNGEAFQKLMNLPGINPLATDLLAQMLRFDPSRRVTVEDALQYSYMEGKAAGDVELQAARDVRPVDWSFDRNLCFDEQGRPRPFHHPSFRKAFFEAIRLVECGGDLGGAGGASPSSARGGSGVVSPGSASAGDDQGVSSPPKRWGRRWRDAAGNSEQPPST